MMSMAMKTVNDEFEELRNMIKELKQPAKADHAHSRSRVACPECNNKFEVCEGCGQTLPDDKPLFPVNDIDNDDEDDDDDEED